MSENIKVEYALLVTDDNNVPVMTVSLDGVISFPGGKPVDEAAAEVIKVLEQWTVNFKKDEPE